MFDIGFAELLIIGVVMLLVIGPERLPETIRTGSAWLARLRRGFNEIKQEVKQELHNDEIMRELREAGEQIKKDTDAVTRDLSATGESIRKEAGQLTSGLVGDTSSIPAGGTSSIPAGDTSSVQLDDAASAPAGDVSPAQPGATPTEQTPAADAEGDASSEVRKPLP